MRGRGPSWESVLGSLRFIVLFRFNETYFETESLLCLCKFMLTKLVQAALLRSVSLAQYHMTHCVESEFGTIACRLALGQIAF